jgi:hypothetical protein
MSFQYRVGLFVAGAIAEAGSGPFGDQALALAATAGLGARASHFRANVLGVLGGHFYGGDGGDSSGSGPAAGGSTPFIGLRTTLSYVFGKRIGHFELGAFAEYDDDLSPSRATTTTAGAPVTDVVGMSRVGFGLELGGSHDIL